MSAAATYKKVTAAIEAGEPVDRVEFDEATEYAKKAKRKAPREADAVFAGQQAPADEEPAEAPAEKPTKKATIKKTPKAAAKKAPAAPKPTTCTEDGCDRAYYAKDRCSMHYAQWRRQDPEERRKANEASAAYRARQKAAEEKAAKAAKKA